MGCHIKCFDPGRFQRNLEGSLLSDMFGISPIEQIEPSRGHLSRGQHQPVRGGSLCGHITIPFEFECDCVEKRIHSLLQLEIIKNQVGYIRMFLSIQVPYDFFDIM